METSDVRLRWLVAPSTVDSAMTDQLTECWREVSNAGGAVGFPFPPVDEHQVRPVVEDMVASLAGGLDRLLVAEVGDRLAGWLQLTENASPLTRHWARVRRVQTSLTHRRRGVGRTLMTEVARAAQEDRGLRHLRLEVRAGMGLEDFYAGLGWRVAGRWPQALHLADDDVRDEILMLLPLEQSDPRP